MWRVKRAAGTKTGAAGRNGAGIIAPMTERGLPSMDGAPACPFVAFGDDRDVASTSPDHRHRCYAESPPAPRALAHQEAYCLSSAFPVCPMFQDWARREAAHARGEGERPATAPTARAAADRGRASRRSADDLRSETLTTAAPATSAPPGRPAHPSETRHGTGQRRRPGRPAQPGAGAAAARCVTAVAPAFLAGRRRESQGLAGTAADRLVGGPVPPAAAEPGRRTAAGSRSAAPTRTSRDSSAGPPTAERDAASGTRRRAGRIDQRSAPPDPRPERERERDPAARHGRDAPLRGLSDDQDTGRAARRRPRLAVLAGALGIAAFALFLLPALLGIGGGTTGRSAPSPSRAGRDRHAPPRRRSPAAERRRSTSSRTTVRAITLPRKWPDETLPGVTLEESRSAANHADAITRTPDRRFALGPTQIVRSPVGAPLRTRPIPPTSGEPSARRGHS